MQNNRSVTVGTISTLDRQRESVDQRGKEREGGSKNKSEMRVAHLIHMSCSLAFN